MHLALFVGRIILSLIIWLAVSLLAIGSVGYGLWSDAKRDVLIQKKLLHDQHVKALGDWQGGAQTVIINLTEHSVLSAKFALAENGLIRISETPIHQASDGAIDLIEAQKKLIVFHESNLANTEEVVYFVRANDRPYAMFIRKLAPSEKLATESFQFIFNLIPAEKLDFQNKRLSDHSGDVVTAVYIYDSFGSELLSRAENQVRLAGDNEFEDILAGGEIVSQAELAGSGISMKLRSTYSGAKVPLIQKLQSTWRVPVAGLIFSLVLFLIIMLSGADSVNEAQNRFKALEFHMVTHAERELQQKVISERDEAQKEMAEGVYGVLRSPISGIRTDINMLKSAASLEEAEDRLKAVNHNLDRISNFIDALKSSSKPGKAAVAKCDLYKILSEFLPTFKVEVAKRGATVIDERVQFVGEVSLPARDARMVFKNLLSFMQMRASKDFKAKNIVLNLEKVPNGARVLFIDNISTTDSDVVEIENDMNFLIAKSVLEKNYINLNFSLVGNGDGIELCCDIMNSDDESVSQITKRMS
ncbi:MAG: HAMP domain-containing histidine kinase [Bdellovibrionales bacterium]|nr:HAMP domain-containing histidine kinase [Bdellovibrionales bacterium]